MRRLSSASLMQWFDAHLDLAYLAVNGRDMLAPLDDSSGPHAPAAVTLPALAEGGVSMALATIFTEPGGTGPEGYPEGDFERAYKAGRGQLEAYLTWQDRGAVKIDLRRLLHVEPGTGEIRGGMGVAEVRPPSARRLAGRVNGKTPLHIGILMENADPIRSADELGWWVERGVVAVGLAWARSSRFAGGNMTQDGLSIAGRELVKAMDGLGVVHDASHLSDRAFADLCSITDRAIVATHSNCRALLGDPAAQRHVTDAQIREIARRGGVIGLNLFAKFIDRRCGVSVSAPGSAPSAEAGAGELARPSLAAAVAHVDHICQITGSREHVGLGSDMDGGFSAARLPEGIDRPRDLTRLADALSRHGWSDDDIFQFACGNWVRFWAGAASGG